MTMRRTDFANRNVAMLGAGATGIAVSRVLRELGARVALSDSAGATELGSRLNLLESLGVDLRIEAAPEDALRGAEMVITSPGLAPDSPVIREAVRRRLPIMSEIEAAYRISRAPIVSVTGTNGKSTVTVMLGEVLRAAGFYAHVAGNISADELKKPLIEAAFEALDNDIIVAEVSSFQLEWVDQFRPAIGILTNITRDHMNRYATFEHYCAAKERMFARQQSTDVAILNAVNVPSRRIGNRVTARRYWFDRGNCATCDSACVMNGVLVVRWGGVEYRLCRVDELRIPGAHNVENALAVGAAAIIRGAHPDAVADALREFAGVVHRMEYVATKRDVRFINNSMCTNVDAAVRSLEAMDVPTVLIAGGVDKNSDFAPLGEALAARARHLVLIGRSAGLIEDAARHAGFNAITFADSMEEAVVEAARHASPGDAVMLSPACASFDMFANFEDRGEAFRTAVRSLAN